MKKYCILMVTLIGFASAQDTLSTDAIYLALRSQDRIHLDSALALEYQYALNQAYNVEDSMQSVHVFPPYVMSTLLVAVDTNWQIPWLDGTLNTGDVYLDSLSDEYGLIDVHHDAWWQFSTNLFTITFDAPAEMWRLGEVFQIHEDIAFAEPNVWGGDGDDIIGFQKNDSTYLAFSVGWGDCMAGCINRYYWMIRTSENDAVLYWEGELNNDDIPVWDIANRRWETMGYDLGIYCFIYFEDAESIYATLLYSSKWWERLYAAEVLWRFYVNDNMWCGQTEHYDQWELTHNYLNGHLDETIAVLLTALNDQDSDVAASAQSALNMLGYVSTEPEAIIPDAVQLYPAFPNPFNPTTTIRFNIPVETQFITSLRIFDITGRVVETLVAGIIEPGMHEIKWNAENHPSGVYFVKIFSGDFTQTQKLVLMK